MNGYRRLLLALGFGAFAIIHLVQSQLDQQGFISLDCGLSPDESPYIDPDTGLKFVSDVDFINTGKRGKVVDDDDVIYTYRQYKDLRYFPDGIRNCYNLTVNKGINYLIRAGFAYGNYDGLNIVPKFHMHIGPNMWTAVAVGREIDREIIYMSKSNLLQICLVKIGETIPIISTLELRPLRNDSYTTQFGPLNLLYREAYTTDSYGFIRYPDDVLDRKWDRYKQYLDDISTTLNVTSSNPFMVPDAVSRSGFSPVNISSPLTSYTYSKEISDQVIIYLHFAEIQFLNASETREFDILFDGTVIQRAYSPKLLQSETKYNISPQKCKSYCKISLERTQRSTLPPFLNAMESFGVIENLYAETNQNDVDAMRNIEANYGLNIISWQGDPCVPEVLKWEGIKCNYTTKSTPPRIISLDLSSNGLKGVITPAFQNLTELQKLDLSNNSLSGQVPEYLASMKSLLVINLNWNNLTGPLPKAFNDREKNGLKLTIQGNQKLSDDASRKKTSNTKYILPVVATTASVLIIVAILILIIVFKKKRPTQST